MKQQYKAFMGQFQAAREEVSQLRTWMGESAKVATLTFPTTSSVVTSGQRTIAGTAQRSAVVQKKKA
jgi:hypothetical protein